VRALRWAGEHILGFRRHGDDEGCWRENKTDVGNVDCSIHSNWRVLIAKRVEKKRTRRMPAIVEQYLEKVEGEERS
jgi:hypothetical protein